MNHKISDRQTTMANPDGLLDWTKLLAELDVQGNAIIPSLLTCRQCQNLIALYDDIESVRSPLLLAADGVRSGDRKYLNPLPGPIRAMRQNLYEPLAVIANRWNAAMGLDAHYPPRLDAWLAQCRAARQTRSLSTLSCYSEGDYEALHQDADGALVFPLQLVILLSEPKRDFTGGEVVMVEQRPRMQSRPVVLSLRQGDAALFAVHHRPFQGARGVYRVTLKHGVSRVHSGRRHALDLLFHDAP